jgi:hypothetical protein
LDTGYFQRLRATRRVHLVEPVFAELKERQGFKRYHRTGLRGARLEFSLHCLAFNLNFLACFRQGLRRNCCGGLGAHGSTFHVARFLLQFRML